MLGDIHFHSTNSDGTKTPEERIKQIQTLDPKNSGFWALTDHDSFSPGFVLPAREVGINAPWATEISAHSNELNHSLHITCYTPVLSEKIRQIVEKIIIWRKVKILWQIQKLQSHGIHIDESSFFEWVSSQRMSHDSATNYHLAQYVWKDALSRQVVWGLTWWVIKSELEFMRECLRENGDYNFVGYFQVPCYEPEISDLVKIAKREDMVLSVAHPNFSFMKKLSAEYWARNQDEQAELFMSKIAPVLAYIGLKNFEVNSLATPVWVNTIYQITQRLWWIVTFGSDNHGLEDADDKHGVLWVQNSMIDADRARRIQSVLRTYI
jgi:histidinol phosphatase-like PHP family hydrolase